MTKTNMLQFAELRELLTNLAFKEKKTPTALAFEHPKEGLLIFRLYKPDEPVDEPDVVSTRKFLDYRGLLDAGEFDAFLGRLTTPA